MTLPKPAICLNQQWWLHKLLFPLYRYRIAQRRATPFTYHWPMAVSHDLYLMWNDLQWNLFKMEPQEIGALFSTHINIYSRWCYAVHVFNCCDVTIIRRCETGPPTELLFVPQMVYEYWWLLEWYGQGKTVGLGEGTVSVSLRTPQLLNGLNLVMNLGLCGEKPATRRLSCGTLCSAYVFVRQVRSYKVYAVFWNLHCH
jgi:hypothetical protein